MSPMSPSDLLTDAMNEALSDNAYDVRSLLEEYAMLRSHGAAEPEMEISWNAMTRMVAGDLFAQYVRGMMKANRAQAAYVPAKPTIIIEKLKCDCLSRRDCDDTKGAPVGGMDASSYGIREFQYSDMSVRHWNKHARSWITVCRRACPAHQALLAKRLAEVA